MVDACNALTLSSGGFAACARHGRQPLRRGQHSSSLSSKLGMPFDTLNRLPVSGQISAPSTSWTCTTAQVWLLSQFGADAAPHGTQGKHVKLKLI